MAEGRGRGSGWRGDARSLAIKSDKDGGGDVQEVTDCWKVDCAGPAVDLGTLLLSISPGGGAQGSQIQRKQGGAVGVGGDGEAVPGGAAVASAAGAGVGAAAGASAAAAGPGRALSGDDGDPSW